MIKLKSFVTLLALISINSVKAIPSKVWNMAPPHWYVGFSNPDLEIIVNASEISAAQVFYEGLCSGE
jgi:general stress protein 26